MSKHFQFLDFLRRVPIDLLKAYCERQGILGQFDWGPRKRADAEAVAQAMRNLGVDVVNRAAVDFRAVWDLSGPTFTKGILNEAGFCNDAIAYEKPSKLSHLGKAFWVTLEHPEWVSNAKILSDVDKLPQGAWIKRGSLASRAGPVDQSAVDRLEGAVVEFFSTTQHRGFNCKIDCLRRRDEEIFFAYAEDHPDTDLFWQDGELTPQILNPSFTPIFKHNDHRKTLEIYVEGDRTIIPSLQQIFARTVIGDEIPREAPSEEIIYNLARIREPGFEFTYAAKSGITRVRITKMRFQIEGEPWRRFMSEADTRTSQEIMDEFVTSLASKFPKSRLFLDQIHINVLFRKRPGDRRTPSRTFHITHPNSLVLKMDELGEKIADMLVSSGIEVIVDESP